MQSMSEPALVQANTRRLRGSLPTVHAVLIACFLLLVTAGLSVAEPITYEITWEVSFTDVLTDYDALVPAPARTTFTYDPVTNLFGGFVVQWFDDDYCKYSRWGGCDGATPIYLFDFATPMNAYLSTADRDFIASSLLSEADNIWEAATHSHNIPDFTVHVDTPGIASPVTVFPLPNTFEDLFWANQTFVYIASNLEWYECNDPPSGCSVSGTYTVTRVPEPSSQLLALIGFGMCAILRGYGRRRRLFRVVAD